MTAHETYMRRCLELAEVAQARGDVPVGSLVVKDNITLAEASERLPASLDIAGHAELLAVRQACAALNTLDLSGCVLYTTAEPCWMCSYVIREAHISLVVIGTPTLTVGGLSSQYPLLSDAALRHWPAPPHIVRNVLLAECQALRQPPSVDSSR